MVSYGKGSVFDVVPEPKPTRTSRNEIAERVWDSDACSYDAYSRVLLLGLGVTTTISLAMVSKSMVWVLRQVSDMMTALVLETFRIQISTILDAT